MTRLTQTDLKKAADRYNVYFDSLNECFVGRSHIVTLFKYAMAQRQHVLIFGPPGTSKTQICDVAFGGIEDSRKFRIEMSMYMGEDALFGPYDTRKMREDGILMHRTEGMLPDAHFARIGEFLDANAAVLRAMLSALHERQMRRGRQIVDMPLLTVYCDTNTEPGDYLKRHPQAWAVLDRILFMERLDYLSEAADLTEMVTRFQQGRVTKHGSKIPMDLINQISEHVILPPTLITSEILFVKYGEAMAEYRLERAALAKTAAKLVLPEISDRRVCLASQMMEVSAVLGGRLEAEPSDMLPISHVIGTTKVEKDLWERIANKKISEIGTFKKQQLNDAQMASIAAIVQQLEAITDKTPIRDAAHTIAVLTTQLNAISPENGTVTKKKAAAEKILEDKKTRAQKQLIAESGLS